MNEVVLESQQAKKESVCSCKRIHGAANAPLCRITASHGTISRRVAVHVGGGGV
jgi:hypothetical protein